MDNMVVNVSAEKRSRLVYHCSLLKTVDGRLGTRNSRLSIGLEVGDELASACVYGGERKPGGSGMFDGKQKREVYRTGTGKSGGARRE
jgi:hypothetical protein